MAGRRFRRIGATLVTVAGLTVIAALATGEVKLVTTHGISMEPRFHTGDLAVVVPSTQYRVGDIVGYHSPLLHIVVLHRIVAEHAGLFTFKGDNNSFLDPRPIAVLGHRGPIVATHPPRRHRSRLVPVSGGPRLLCLPAGLLGYRRRGVSAPGATLRFGSSDDRRRRGRPSSRGDTGYLRQEHGAERATRLLVAGRPSAVDGSSVRDAVDRRLCQAGRPDRANAPWPTVRASRSRTGRRLPRESSIRPDPWSARTRCSSVLSSTLDVTARYEVAAAPGGPAGKPTSLSGTIGAQAVLNGPEGWQSTLANATPVSLLRPLGEHRHSHRSLTDLRGGDGVRPGDGVAPRHAGPDRDPLGPDSGDPRWSTLGRSLRPFVWCFR